MDVSWEAVGLDAILVVEDDRRLARYLELELGHEGYAVDRVGNGWDALDRAREREWQLIILDVMLPGLNGFEVCRRIRQCSNVPILMLTAKTSVDDRVRGLDSGADDYLAKPFAIAEMLARVRALLRRGQVQPLAGGSLRVADLVIDVGERRVERAGVEISLTKREFDLLLFLARHARQVLSRSQILEHVWGYGYAVEDNIVDVYIRHLRAKLDDPFPTRLIQTVRGVGYTLKGN